MLGRPTKAELQSAITQIEHLGDYQTHFKTDTTLNSEVPYYQEYNYLHSLVISTQTLVDHYDDADWLNAHQVTNETFREALADLTSAYRGCSLIFGLNRTANTTDTKTEAKPTTSDTPTTSNTNSTSNTAIAKTTTTQTSQAANTKTTVKAETFNAPATSNTVATTKTSEVPTSASTDTKADAQDNTTEEIALPATGAVETTRQMSGTAVFAVVLTGAIIASALIAVILRHEPRHNTRTHRRH